MVELTQLHCQKKPYIIKCLDSSTHEVYYLLNCIGNYTLTGSPHKGIDTIS